MDFDEVLERVGGGWERYQLWILILVGIGGMPTGVHNLAIVFLAGRPKSWCKDDRHANDTGWNGTELSPTQDACVLYPYAHNNSTWSTTPDTGKPGGGVACTEWEYDMTLFGRTIVTEWDLVCSRKWLGAMSQTLYMTGFLLGAIGFGSLSDRIGRKKSWLIAMGSLTISGTAAGFAPEFWSFSFLRLLSGASAAGFFTCAFVIYMEIFNIRTRIIPGVMLQGFFGIGYALLSGVALALKDAFILQLVNSVPLICFMSYIWLLDESPRWLLSQGRIKEATVVIRKIARFNKREWDEEKLTAEYYQIQNEKQKSVTPEKRYTALDLMKHSQLRSTSLIVFFGWFVVSMVYYGLSLGSSDLAGSPYLNLFISALMEFPAMVIAIVAMNKVGRRWPFIISLASAGVMCLIVVVIPAEYPGLTITFAMLGKLGSATAFDIIYVFSGEVFPTVVRTAGVGAGSMCARIGSLIAPLADYGGQLVWKPFPMVLFGALALASGALSILLPETLGRVLPNTIEDAEELASKKRRNTLVPELDKDVAMT